MRDMAYTSATIRMLVCTPYYARGAEAEPDGERARLLDRLLTRSGTTAVVSDAVFRTLCETVNPQGIGAVIACPAQPDLDTLLRRAKRLLLLEHLQDPGNLGTCIRTADAFAYDGVLCIADCVEAYNPKVLRSTVGSLFHLPVLPVSEGVGQVLERLRGAGFIVYGAHPRGGKKSSDSELFTGKMALLIGNEGAGLSEAAKRGCDALVTVPMPGNAESLNAGIAAAVLMYETVRA